MSWRALLPVHRIHHICKGYGYVLAWWPGEQKPARFDELELCGDHTCDPPRRRVEAAHFAWASIHLYHDCTATGVY